MAIPFFRGLSKNDLVFLGFDLFVVQVRNLLKILKLLGNCRYRRDT